MKKIILSLSTVLVLGACTGLEVAGTTLATGIVYGTSVLERSSDDNGVVDNDLAKETIDNDIDYVTDKASEIWAAREPLDPSKLND